jgi:catechol 2,3-dioxygenase-like lactoylglutathione lyase family enzyme
MIQVFGAQCPKSPELTVAFSGTISLLGCPIKSSSGSLPMQTVDRSILQELDLPGVGQLGFVVRDIPAALPAYTALYNLPAWFEPRYLQRQFFVGGVKIEMGFQIAFAYSGKLQVELVQAPAGEHIYSQYLAQSGEGLHHLGFYLADLDRRLALVRQVGIPVLLEGRLKTAGGSQARFAYLDTRQACGIIVELIEIKTFGVSLPQTEFWMKIGARTGDVRRIRS